ncbi:response regulator [Thermoactinospora rubra]|uniref:response regulator n=1 Tax=Thermoactinospora rubra TaxID=1088767 RepID=UPI001F0A37F3|nr:response regulator [Thermoactinospora rubra]
MTSGEWGRSMIRVLLAEDMHMVRGALVALLELEPDITVVAQAAAGDQILPAALEHEPDVAVIDVELPGLDGLTATAELRRRLPRCRVLVVTSFARPANVRRAFAAQASGFLVKHAPPDQLADAIRKVAAGEQVIDPQLAVAALGAADSPLKPRELEVLRRFSDGQDIEQIAQALFLSAGTAHNFHIHEVAFQVLDVNGNKPPAYASGHKDTVYVPPKSTVRLAVQFGRFTDPATPYMYHCHILRHEDSGMMGQFVIVAPGTENQTPRTITTHTTHHG